MAGRIEKGKLAGLALVHHVDLVGADVLRDAAGLAGGDLSLADRVQQARFTVVDVAHHRDDRRSRHPFEVLLDGGLVQGRGAVALFRGRDRRPLAHLETELGRDDGGRVVVDLLVLGREDAVADQRLNDMGRSEAEELGQIADRDDARQLDGTLRWRGGQNSGLARGLTERGRTASAAQTSYHSSTRRNMYLRRPLCELSAGCKPVAAVLQSQFTLRPVSLLAVTNFIL